MCLPAGRGSRNWRSRARKAAGAPQPRSAAPGLGKSALAPSMSGPVGPGPFPPDQPHTPDDLRRGGLVPILAASAPTAAASRKTYDVHRGGQRLESQRFPWQIVFPCLMYHACPTLTAPVHRRGQRPDEWQVSIPLSIVKAVPHDELIADVESRVGNVHLH